MNKITTLLLATLVTINSRPVNAINPVVLVTAGAAGAMALSEAWSIKQVNRHREGYCNKYVDKTYYRDLLANGGYWADRQLNTINAMEKDHELYSNRKNLIQLFAGAVANGEEYLAKSCLYRLGKRPNDCHGMDYNWYMHDCIAGALKSKKTNLDVSSRLKLLEKIGVKKDFILQSIRLSEFELPILPALMAYGIKATGKDISAACVDTTKKAEVIEFYLKHDPSLANADGQYSNLFGDVTLYCDDMSREAAVTEARRKIAILNKAGTPISDLDIRVSDGIAWHGACQTLRKDMRAIMAERASLSAEPIKK